MPSGANALWEKRHAKGQKQGGAVAVVSRSQLQRQSGRGTETSTRRVPYATETPAIQYHDLPEEVQRYINRIEMEAYDQKQDAAVGRALVGSAISVALLFLNYEGYFGTAMVWVYLAGVLLLVAPWIRYWYEWRKNAEEFIPSGDASGPTDEGIRQEWEVEYISQSRKAERESSGAQS